MTISNRTIVAKKQGCRLMGIFTKRKEFCFSFFAFATALEEPCEGRLSRTVLWEGKGEIPLPEPISIHFMTTKTTYILTILIMTCGLFACGQDSASKKPTKAKSNFSLSITTYNHAGQIFNGITTYHLKNDTLKIHKKFMFSDKDTILFSQKLDTNSIDQIEKIRLDSLEDFYFNYCIMPTSGNEYFISTTIDTVDKKISLHHYYNEQIERLINRDYELIE